MFTPVPKFPPTVINGNGETSQLYYDGNNARWKQIYTRGSTTETTIYVGGLLHKVEVGGVVDYRHSITAGGKTVAIMSRTNSGTNTTRYTLHDGLGSVAKITDSSGANVVSESFTAFGARRNPLTWSGDPTNGDLTTSEGITREGFTGHEMLGRMGLNHMNGRVQDAITGRFLSADPFIDHTFGTQGFNRYSYVGNNPLSFTDPSGFFGGYGGGEDAQLFCDMGYQEWCLDEVVITARPWERSFCVACVNPGQLGPGEIPYAGPPLLGATTSGTGEQPKPPKPQEKKSVPCGGEGSGGHGSIEAGAHAGSAAQLATDSRALQLLGDVEASRHRIGRPPNSMRLPMPGTNGSPSVQGWRATMARNAGWFEAGARVTGGAATAVDGYLMVENIRHGDPLQGGLDGMSAAAGLAMFISFEATAPIAVPALIGAKLSGPANRAEAKMRCEMGYDNWALGTFP